MKRPKDKKKLDFLSAPKGKKMVKKDWHVHLNELVRPTLAVVFGGAFIYGFIVSLISAEVFVSVASVIITWFFKTRDEIKNASSQ